MQEKLNVVFTIDENYIQHFTVACTSLLENNHNIGRIFLVHDIKNNNNLKKSIGFFKGIYNVDIEELDLDSTILENFKISHHISKATYFRLLLSEILPLNIDKILFLDSDIVVIGDLSKIAKLSFFKNSEYYIFAVNHKYDDNNLGRLRDIGFSGSKYFNAGIMYINLKKWREDRISKTLIENATKYSNHLLWWDQDVLNITFDLQWEELDYVYNAFGLTEKDESKKFKIIHYTGSSKPWHFRNNHPYKKLYWKYLRMTPFKRYIPDDLTIMDIIKMIIPIKYKKLIKGLGK